MPNWLHYHLPSVIIGKSVKFINAMLPDIIHDISPPLRIHADLWLDMELDSSITDRVNPYSILIAIESILKDEIIQRKGHSKALPFHQASNPILLLTKWSLERYSFINCFTE